MLGLADWSQYTVGENGIKVTDIWPGIDLYIAFQLETVKKLLRSGSTRVLQAGN